MAVYHTNYWKRRNINGPQSWPFFGSLLSLIDPNKPSVFVIHEWTRRFGRIFGYQHGWTNVLVLSDPDDVHDVLVKKFDCFGERRSFCELQTLFKVSPNMTHETAASTSLFASPLNRWRRLRSISNPAFSSSNLKQLFPILNDSAAETVRLLEKGTR
ncbi:hypothetical protein M3Y97_00152600 [Aphelenchoides bicaudatus]|nr:hypothetical protein M3Y97_00152600 [Aphelenchoides bicaudatus]